MDKVSLKKKAKLVLMKNLKRGINKGTEYCYICPARKKYPHQWFWDSCFHSIAMLHFDPELSKKELLTLAACASSDGFMPHIKIWKRKRHTFNLLFEPLLMEIGYASSSMSRFIQPPLIGYCAERVYEKTEDLKFLEFIYPILKRYYDYLSKKRDIDGDKLITTIHSVESLDASPVFDKLYGFGENIRKNTYARSCFGLVVKHRLHNWENKRIASYFGIKDIMVNSIYAHSLLSMSRLAGNMGRKRDKQHFLKQMQGVENSIKKCWNKEDNIFYCLDNNDKQIEVKTIHSLFPLLTSIGKSKARHLAAHIQDGFSEKYPISVIAKGERAYNHKGNLLWRGCQTWINTNWFLVQVLRKQGFDGLASDIEKKSVGLVSKSGFREFFDSRNGKGLGEKDYSWTALVVDML